MLFFAHRAPMYETNRGEQRILTLEDGSQIELNARSRVRVSFTSTSRAVQLIQGQAFFRVAKDAQRPFTVNSSDALVRAVGTQFDVYRKDSGTTVTVVEGRVLVQSGPSDAAPGGSPAGNPQSEPLQAVASLDLSAGEQAVVTASSIAKSPHINVAAVTAWTQGQLEFDETPLSEVISEFNRYAAKPLVVASPSLNTLTITGVYSSMDGASLLLFLRSQPDLVVTETDTEIRLTSR
jgi:transmembrane sensor